MKEAIHVLKEAIHVLKEAIHVVPAKAGTQLFSKAMGPRQEHSGATKGIPHSGATR